ncbi:MAG: flagellar motor switch protein FliN [Nitrosomonas sp.]|nr:MAG: flagellar motor switch protein FliN [Nitrosomonas sp.]
MSKPTENEPLESDDWTAAMAEQAAATQHEPESQVDDWAAAMAEQEAATQSQSNNNSMTGAQAATATVFQEFSKDSALHNSRYDIDLILDIPVQMTVELGRTKITIKNLLQLAQGSVVELDGMAGEPMDVLVNGCLIAQGEVVVVNDKFGIRLTDIITPSERIRKLNR